MAAIGASAIFATVTGSPIATAFNHIEASLSEMRRSGYDDRLSTGSIATGGLLGPIIPPSIPMVIYGAMTNTSIAMLFAVTIVNSLAPDGMCNWLYRRPR
jgi:TRAP-type C4-dicarboxylate transport system permease large subunit